MKMKAKTVAAILVVMLILAAFPMSVGAAHYYPCDRAQFIRDVTVPDGSSFAPGDTFTKTWRLRNTGSCTWTATDYKLVFTDGNAFGAATSQALTKDVPPWSYVDLTITGMTAPATPGKYFSYWKLENSSGDQFGVGWGGRVAIFALINVVTPPSVTYDFAAEADSAIWTSGVPGSLTFPGTPGDSIGSVVRDPAPHFENNVTATNPGLVVSPNDAYNGFIEGYYPEYTVKKGDRFQTTVGCEYGHPSCYVAFSLKYQIGSGPVHTLWTFRERYEGLTYSANINLDWLAGKDVNFILSMSAYGSPAGDSAIWGHPVIVGTGTTSGTPGGSTAGWNTYRDSTVPFSFMFPPDSTVDNSIKTIDLPYVAGTNLDGKYLVINTSSAGTGDCLTEKPNPSEPESVTFNGLTFMKETGLDAVGEGIGAQDWVAYSIKDKSDKTCVSLTFTLSYIIPENSENPEFNEVAESAVFEKIMSTFEW